MYGLSGMDSIEIPDGWESIALFGRLVTKGICSCEYLRSPRTSVRSAFEALRMLDFRDYCELKAMEKAKANDR